MVALDNPLNGTSAAEIRVDLVNHLVQIVRKWCWFFVCDKYATWVKVYVL